MSSFPTDPINTATPPILPPKTASQEASRIGTPSSSSTAHHQQQQYAPPPPPQSSSAEAYQGREPPQLPPSSQPGQQWAPPPPPPSIPDPGDQWLPQMLQDKSKQDIAEILSSPALLTSLTHSSSTGHPSLTASHQHLSHVLASNVHLASHLSSLSSQLSRMRSDAQAQLLATHALERQWRQKQTAMDDALGAFSPASLYQQLGQGLAEQGHVCAAMEESFLEEGGDGGGAAAAGLPSSEREVAEWVRRYREARVLFYLREERKGRWDEGRVGGWR